jgi:glycosyltransferase involved in cell wall biosynthesis
MSFTVVIPFWNGHQYLAKLLATIPESIPVLLIDDLSDSPLPEIEQPNVQVKRLTAKGYFTGAVNKGLESCTTDVLVLNQDVFFTDTRWLNFIEDNRQHYGIFGERAGAHPAWPRRYVHGTFMYIRRDVIDTIGLLDAENYPLWGGTCEYQLRACRRGFKAHPVEDVPGFVHKRRGPYGSAIQQALYGATQRGKLIRTPPMVSVVITCYNYGRFLPDAVNSLIGGKTSLGKMPGQTLQSFEIIIVDDGSTDNSAQIAENLADPWQGIHFVSQRNQGSAVAMNTGIETSHARKDSLVAVLDGDDMMEAPRLERMVKAWELNRHSVIYDNIQYFANGQRGVVTDWQRGKTIDKLDLRDYDFEQILKKNRMHKGLLYPRRAWEEVGGYPPIMNQGREDWAFNIALGVKGWCGINTREYEYLYRRELQNRTLRNTTPRHFQMFLKQIQDLFPNIYRGERPEMCCGNRPVAKSQKNGRAARTMADLPGKKGMILLEYQGSNAGDETWHGPVTGTPYALGGVKRRGYVDKQDAYGNPGKRDGFLNLKESGKRLFTEVVIEPPAPEPEPVPEEIQEEAPEPIRILGEMPIPDWEQEKGEVITLDIDYVSILRTVSNIKEAVDDLGRGELEVLLNMEQEGKNRSTAITVIEDALERVA